MYAARSVGIVLILTVFAQPLLAWSESGHHLIALLAFDLLSSDEQTQLLRILSAHPRYAEDFGVPNNIDEADRWQIGRAGYWPDVARKQPKYNRPTWHYHSQQP